MKIYIDFDGTIFDTDKYLANAVKIFNKHGITNEIYEETKKNIFNSEQLFNINKLTDYFIDKYNCNNKLKYEINSLLNKSYIYSDCFECLKKLKNNGYTLYLLTFGDEENQKMKINSSNISKYFDDIIITQKDKSELNIDYKNSIFIDNNPYIIEKIYKTNAKKIIRIRRKSDKYAKVESNILDMVECENFNNILKIMKGDSFN